MVRYCNNCKKDYDFKIKSSAELDSLICPGCGQPVDKNSRRPVDNSQQQKNYENIGKTMVGVMHFIYCFYLLISLVGIACYVLKYEKGVYVATAVVLVAFIIQFLIGQVTFTTGFIFIPLGAVLFYYKFKTVTAACLGILVVFALRHLIRDIIFRLLHKFYRWCRSL